MEIERETTEVELAFDAWSTALDHLVKVVEDGGLDALDDHGLVEFFRGVESVRRRTPLVDHRAIRDAERRRLPDTLAQPSMIGVLGWALRLSPAEAGRRVRASELVGERIAMTGEHLAPVRPSLALAQRSGAASAEAIDICLRALEQVDHRGFDPAGVEAGEELLAQFATQFEPKTLRQLADQVVDHVDPDGSVPDDELQRERRHLALRSTRDGTWVLDGRLTGAVGAKLSAVLSPLAAPRTEPVADDGAPIGVT